jgi:hypothetical protein
MRKDIPVGARGTIRPSRRSRTFAPIVDTRASAVPAAPFGRLSRVAVASAGASGPSSPSQHLRRPVWLMRMGRRLLAFAVLVRPGRHMSFGSCPCIRSNPRPPRSPVVEARRSGPPSDRSGHRALARRNFTGVGDRPSGPETPGAAATSCGPHAAESAPGTPQTDLAPIRRRASRARGPPLFKGL